MKTLEERSQIPKAYAAISCVIVLGLLLLINPLASPISNLIGWTLPAYLSFQAIESPSSHDDVQWLTYWVVFGLFNLLENFALGLILYYLPWYFPLKTIFVLWLQLPSFRVSTLVLEGINISLLVLNDPLVRAPSLSIM